MGCCEGSPEADHRTACDAGDAAADRAEVSGVPQGRRRAGRAGRQDQAGHRHRAFRLGPMRAVREEPHKKARDMGFSQEEIDEAAWVAIAFGGSPAMVFYNALRKTLVLGGDWYLVVPLVFKTSVGPARVPGGFDSHSPPLYCARSPSAVQVVTQPGARHVLHSRGRLCYRRERDEQTVYVVDHSTSHPAGPAADRRPGFADLWGDLPLGRRCWRTTKPRQPSRSPREFAPGPPGREAFPPGGPPFGELLPLVKKTVKRVETVAVDGIGAARDARSERRRNRSARLRRVEADLQRRGARALPFVSEMKGGHGVHGQEQVGVRWREAGRLARAGCKRVFCWPGSTR